MPSNMNNPLDWIGKGLYLVPTILAFKHITLVESMHLSTSKLHEPIFFRSVHINEKLDEVCCFLRNQSCKKICWHAMVTFHFQCSCRISMESIDAHGPAGDWIQGLVPARQNWFPIELQFPIDWIHHIQTKTAKPLEKKTKEPQNKTKTKTKTFCQLLWLFAATQ